MNFKQGESGQWVSDCGRWLVIREVPGRYDLYDKKRRKKDDQLVGMAHDSVAACQEVARGIVWAEEQEKDPEGRRKLRGHQ